MKTLVFFFYTEVTYTNMHVQQLFGNLPGQMNTENKNRLWGLLLEVLDLTFVRIFREFNREQRA